ARGAEGERGRCRAFPRIATRLGGEPDLVEHLEAIQRPCRIPSALRGEAEGEPFAARALRGRLRVARDPLPQTLCDRGVPLVPVPIAAVFPREEVVEIQPFGVRPPRGTRSPNQRQIADRDTAWAARQLAGPGS